MVNFQIVQGILIFSMFINIMLGYPICQYELNYYKLFPTSFSSEHGYHIWSFECSLKNITEDRYASPYYEDRLSIKVNDSSLGMLTSNDMDFYRNSKILELFLNHTGIKMIVPGAFNGMTELLVLNLQNNEIQEISSGTFISLFELRVLHLENNLLATVDNLIFTELLKLTFLYLNDNKFSLLGNSVFSTIPTLECLDISNNPLKNANFTLSLYLLFANKLNLSDIDSNPESIVLKNKRNLTITIMASHIRNLSLSNNNFSTLTNQISIPGLKYVNLSHNMITGFDEKFFSKVNNMKVLDLHGIKLESLPQGIFHNLTNLTFLDLSNNNLKFFSDETISGLGSDVFSKLNNLTVLKLHGNELESLPHGVFRNLTTLEYLDLSNNNLKYFGYGTFDHLKNLMTLNLSTNYIRELNIYALRDSKVLENLYLDNNQLKSIDLSYLKYLRYVSLDNNIWYCEDLSRIVYELQSRRIDVIYGTTHNNQNIHKIACDDIELPLQTKDNFNSTNFDKYFTQMLSRMMDTELAKFKKPDPYLDAQGRVTYKSSERIPENSNSFMYLIVIGLYINIIILFTIFLYLKFSTKRIHNYDVSRIDNAQVELL